MNRLASIPRAAAVLFFFLGYATAYADEQALSGEQAFAACAGCHSLVAGAAHKVGPNLFGVSGRTAASADGFNYSPALRESGLIWTRENLFAWIASSEALVPGSWMLYHNVLRPEEVLSLIDYLDAQAAPVSDAP
ncbi:MAG: cytochrome c family protein [Congregibacter sp.]